MVKLQLILIIVSFFNRQCPYIMHIREMNKFLIRFQILIGIINLNMCSHHFTDTVHHRYDRTRIHQHFPGGNTSCNCLYCNIYISDACQDLKRKSDSAISTSGNFRSSLEQCHTLLYHISLKFIYQIFFELKQTDILRKLL